MGLKVLVSSKPKSGKTLFTLSAAALGPMAVVDTEFSYHLYTTEGNEPNLRHPIERVAKLLDIPVDSKIYTLQTANPASVKKFLAEYAARPDIVTLALDSMSVVWDQLTSTVQGRQDWPAVKRPLRQLQYLALSSGKHYIFTAHRNNLYSEDMTKKIGEFPWSDKKDPHWADLILELKFPQGASRPDACVEGERSAGILKVGMTLRNPTFPELAKLLGQIPEMKNAEMLSPDELDYRTNTLTGIGGE